MKFITLFLLMITFALHADSQLKSDVVIENESYALQHEFAYGVSNNYSLLSIEHQIQAENDLIFHYGTCVGLIVEDYTAQNGFGPNADEMGLIIEANLGVDYILQDYQTLSLEGSHSQNQLIDVAEQQIQFNYQYKF